MVRPISSAKPVFAAAFDQGQVPTIAIVNRASLSLRITVEKLVAAAQQFVDRHFGPVWGTPCKLVAAKGSSIPAGQWAIVLLDTADAAGALGYHDLTPAGMPQSKVFVRDTIADGGEVSVTFSHELAEMLVDPGLQIGAIHEKSGIWYAYEVADAVQDESFLVAGVPMTNFQYPAWFEEFRKPKSARFDHLGHCTKPFQILKGGYMPVFKAGKWTQLFGSKSAERAFASRPHPRTARRLSDGRAPIRSRKGAA